MVPEAAKLPILSSRLQQESHARALQIVGKRKWQKVKKVITCACNSGSSLESNPIDLKNRGYLRLNKLQMM